MSATTGSGPPTEAGKPTTEKVKGIFSTIAGRYDLLNSLTSLGMHGRWRRRCVREAALEPGCAVLDLAAGTGDLAIALAETGTPASVLATDLVPEMLAVAERKVAGRRGPTELRFEVQDAQALTLPDASYDVVTVAFGVRNMPDRAANFGEALRVLKPGGRYVVLEFSRPHAWFRPLYFLYTGTVVPLLGALVAGDRSSYQYLNDSIRAFPPQEALAAELRAAGFSRVRWVDMLFGGVALHVAEK
ncbi:MAG TPA: ubiquinone/menaquinone biosynthesis methyltransferase [Coriobacteriia bacterium]